jgi:hypothetical protein
MFRSPRLHGAARSSKSEPIMNATSIITIAADPSPCEAARRYGDAEGGSGPLVEIGYPPLLLEKQQPSNAPISRVKAVTPSASGGCSGAGSVATV